MIWKCVGCGYEIESSECEECPMCGSSMTRVYDDEEDDGDIF